MADGSKWVGWVAIAAGLVLLGMCLSQWDQDTGSTMGRAVTAYNQGDRGALAGLGSGALRQSSQTGVEGLAGVFWLGMGIFLLKRSGAGAPKTRGTQGLPPRRR